MKVKEINTIEIFNGKRKIVLIVTILFFFLALAGCANVDKEQSEVDLQKDDQIMKITDQESSLAEGKEFLLSMTEVDWDTPEIIRVSKEVTEGIDSDYEKSQAIYNWVTDNIKYESYYEYSVSNEPWYQLTYASSVIDSKESNCLGFANLNAALHRAIGIEARVVDGWSYNPNFEDSWMTSEECRHAWNEVLIDGEWILQDPTNDWGRRPRKYFDLDSEEFEKDHVRDGVIY